MSEDKKSEQYSVGTSNAPTSYMPPPPAYSNEYGQRVQPPLEAGAPSYPNVTPYSINGNNFNGTTAAGRDYDIREDEYYNLDPNVPGAPIVDPNYDEKKETYDEVFPMLSTERHYNDWPFTVLFLITCAAFITIAGITFRAWSHTGATGIYTSNNTGTLTGNSAILLVFVCIIAVVFSSLGVMLCRAYPRVFVIAGMIVNILAGLGTAITYFSLKYWSAGIVFLVFTAIIAFCYWSMRVRIPLTVAILTVVIDTMKKYPQTVIISCLNALVSGAFGLMFSMTIVATYMKYDPSAANPGCNTNGGSCSTSKLIGVLVVLFFCGYYISEVIKNVVHVTISGVYGSWYYRANSTQGMPTWPAIGALKRALTYSFGSICFGSLIVSLIETLRQILILVKNSSIVDQGWGTRASQFGVLLIDWILGFIQWIAQYFNHYAYSYIALYGKPYLKAAKETWYMFREKGFDALINDSLVNTALGLYSMFTAYMVTLFAFLFLRFTTPDYNSTGGYNAPLMAFSFVIGLQLSNIINSVIRSGVSAFFVALAHDPEVFRISYPEKFDEIFAAYPQVLHKLGHHHV